MSAPSLLKVCTPELRLHEVYSHLLAMREGWVTFDRELARALQAERVELELVVLSQPTPMEGLTC